MTRPAGLKDYQIVLTAGVLYGAWAQEFLSRVVTNGSAAQLAPTIEIIGDTCDVYGSQLYPADPKDPTADMPILISGLVGLSTFDVVPNYIYVDGSPTSVVIAGLQVAPINFISAKNVINTYAHAALTDHAELRSKNQILTYNKGNLLLN